MYDLPFECANDGDGIILFEVDTKIFSATGLWLDAEQCRVEIVFDELLSRTAYDGRLPENPAERNDDSGLLEGEGKIRLFSCDG